MLVIVLESNPLGTAIDPGCWMLDPGYERGRRPRLRLAIAQEGIELLQKRFAGLGQSFFEPLRTIAIAARPRLGPVFVTTITTRMRVFYRQEIKIFLPIGALFFQWRITKTSFHPMRLAFSIDACHLHVVPVLVTRD